MSTQSSTGTCDRAAIRSEVTTAIVPAMRMKRLLAILALIAGAVGAELTQPVQCGLTCSSRPWSKRREL
jgi:hypothetical protein